MTDIGAMLREARMREHRDIVDYEGLTKIRAKYLRALEDEEWSLLPGYTFTKSFLRTYADMLGLDGRMLVDEFKRQHPDPAEVELNPVMPSRRDQRPGDRGKRAAGPSGRMLAAALLVVVIAAAVFVVRELTKGKSPPARTTQTTSTTSSTTSRHRGATTTPALVALQITVVSPVHVCLIGYTTHDFAHQRIPPHGATSALLTPTTPEPVYHADRDFRVSFSGGVARMTIGPHHVAVNATTTTLSYRVTRTGATALSPASAPRCA